VIPNASFEVRQVKTATSSMPGPTRSVCTPYAQLPDGEYTLARQNRGLSDTVVKDILLAPRDVRRSTSR